MESRYSFMKQSKYKDEGGDYFPDPTTLNYNNLESTHIKSIELTELSCEKFWSILPSVFGVYELDDVLLSINRIPHRNMLKPGDVIFSPSVQEIRDSFTSDS